MTTDHAWDYYAECRKEDPELFHPTGEGAVAILQIERAKAICSRCPVIEECLEDALRVEGCSRPGARHDVRGGLTGKERYDLHRRRDRQRVNALTKVAT